MIYYPLPSMYASLRMPSSHVGRFSSPNSYTVVGGCSHTRMKTLINTYLCYFLHEWPERIQNDGMEGR